MGLRRTGEWVGGSPEAIAILAGWFEEDTLEHRESIAEGSTKPPAPSSESALPGADLEPGAKRLAACTSAPENEHPSLPLQRLRGDAGVVAALESVEMGVAHMDGYRWKFAQQNAVRVHPVHLESAGSST